MFDLAVMFKEGNVMGGSFNAQHAPKLVVYLDGSAAHVILDASPLGPGGQTGAELLCPLEGVVKVGFIPSSRGKRQG